MALDLEEQEQLDEFKAWWDKNGKMLINAIIAGLIAFAAWQAYQSWVHKKAAEASNIYQTLVTTDTSKSSEIKLQSTMLKDNYSSTPYAGRAAVFAAKASYLNKDTADAKVQLEWAIKNAKESSVSAIASIELAGILYENKEYDAANKVLNDIKDPGFYGLRDNMLGDILLAQNKPEDAKKAFEKAMQNLDHQGKLFRLTKQKLESLG
jgi:predicted negative regulator of RcsB-dependent stress response